MLVHLNNPARSVPLVGMRTSLVLHAHKVPHFEGREAFSMLSPNLNRAVWALAEGLLSCCQCLAPHCLVPVSPRGDRDAVPYWSAEDAHGWRNFRVTVWRVALVQYRPLHRVRDHDTVVTIAGIEHSFDHSLGTFLAWRKGGIVCCGSRGGCVYLGIGNQLCEVVCCFSSQRSPCGDTIYLI